jgi:hypothetical protein
MDSTEYYNRITRILRRAQKNRGDPTSLFKLIEEESISDDPPFEATLINDSLWLGSASDAMYPKALKERKITIIVNVAAGQCAEIQRIERIAGNGSQWERIEFTEEWYKNNCDSSFRYLAIHAEDHPKYNIEKDFDTVNNFLESLQGGVLIHCVQGINRSAAIAVAVLMNRKSLSALEAIEHIATKRPGVLSNRAFVKKLISYENSLRGVPLCDEKTQTRRVITIGNIVER